MPGKRDSCCTARRIGSSGVWSDDDSSEPEQARRQRQTARELLQALRHLVARLADRLAGRGAHEILEQLAILHRRGVDRHGTDVEIAGHLDLDEAVARGALDLGLRGLALHRLHLLLEAAEQRAEA